MTLCSELELRLIFLHCFYGNFEELCLCITSKINWTKILLWLVTSQYVPILPWQDSAHDELNLAHIFNYNCYYRVFTLVSVDFTSKANKHESQQYFMSTTSTVGGLWIKPTTVQLVSAKDEPRGMAIHKAACYF